MIWPFTLSMTGPGEYFAVWEIVVAVAIDPFHAGDTQTNIRAVGGDDAVIALAVEKVGEALLALADALPGGDRVRLVQEAGPENEILIFRQAHLRVLRRSLRRILRAAPAQVLVGGTGA